MVRSVQDGPVRAHAGVDFNEPVSATKDVEQAVQQLVFRHIPAHLLLDLDVLGDDGPNAPVLKAGPDHTKLARAVNSTSWLIAVVSFGKE